MSKLKELIEQRKDAIAAAQVIQATAKDDDDRDLTDEEQKAVEAHVAKARSTREEIDKLNARRDAQNKLDLELAAEAALDKAVTPRISAPPNLGPSPNPGANIGNPRLASEDDPQGSFASHTEFLLSVLATGQAQTITDDRLRPLATVGSDEAGTYGDPVGGFLVPSSFSPTLLTVNPEADPTAGRTTAIPMDSPVVEIPARTDKNHSNSVSGGLRVYRRAEADTSPTSRVELEQVVLRASMLFGVSHATEELLSRSAISFIALLQAGFSDEFNSKMLREKLNGSGVGMMEGVLTTPSLITVAKETGQDADTIVTENIIKMRARCWGFGSAIWMANHDTLPQLMTMTLDVGTGGVPIWIPSIREDAPDLLLGRPIFYSEHMETIGDKGDILLGNWSQYLEGLLSGPQQAESIHVRFVNHERTFKFWMENDGKCWWRTALTPDNGSTLSPFVTVAAR